MMPVLPVSLGRVWRHRKFLSVEQVDSLSPNSTSPMRTSIKREEACGVISLKGLQAGSACNG